MMRAIIISAFVVCATAKVTWRELEQGNYSFDRYIKDFRMQYSSSEMGVRRAYFNVELERVRAHNAKGLSWKEGLNQFSAMTVEEKKSFHGRSKGAAAASKKSPLKHQQSAEQAGLKVGYNEMDLPASVDWREKNIITPVKDQGSCGSCWAFAATATIESYVALSSGLLFSLSPEQIAMCAPNPDSCGGFGGCEGSTAELAFEYLSSSDGIFEEFQYPYISYNGTDQPCNTVALSDLTSQKGSIDGFVKLPENSYSAVMKALATVGPLAINVDASTWHAYESGVFNGCNQASPDVNHVVQLVGYGTEPTGEAYWLVRNSWSPNYGEAGYIKLARQNAAEEQICGTDTTPQDGTGCEYEKETPVTVCGTCGVIYDASYPLLAKAIW